MSHLNLNPGLISAYNSLTDKHLAGYFSNTRIRRHLQRAGLITRSGRIVPDKEYRHKLIQRAHQRHMRECLAQAIFHKVLELERVHQIEIKRKLEEFARRERVHKIKVERSKRYEEEIIRILSPRPPTGARGIRKQHSGPEGEHSESSESPGSSRPNTAPGKMQRPVRLKPIHSNSTTASLRRSSPYRLHESSNENEQPFNCTVDKESRRRFNTMEASHGISPYCLPVINNFVTPVPPPTKRRERGLKVTPSGTLRGRRLRPTTASSGADITEDPPMLRSSVHQSRVCVNMMYFGKTVHLSHDLTDMRDEVKVFQQHCGGENLCVFKGKLREGETFQFISRRHRGFPFSLTFFLNGLQVERLSSCCEFKHRKGSRLGGRHGHFGFFSVEGASPCYKCIIAMGLDKKPTPPPKRVKEDRRREESVITPKEAAEMRTERTRGDAASHSESENVQHQDVNTRVKEETTAEEDKVRDDYEEDFEADDEAPAEVTEAKEKRSPSPPAVTERQVKERDASETEEEEKDEDIKSRSGSSSSGSDREESDAEATKDPREDDKAEQPKEVDEEEAAPPPEVKDEPHPEESAATEAESTAPKDSDIPNSAGESTEIDISDTSVPSGNENKQSDDTSGEKEVQKTVDESKQEEEQERAKSVQEKLAEAILLKESHCSSEPELSDTSTEDTVESTDKGRPRDNKDAAAEKSVTSTEQQQTVAEETRCEEGVVAVAEVLLNQEETSELKKEDLTEQAPVENSDAIKDEEVKIDEEEDKVASEEDKNTAEKEKSEETEDAVAALLPVFTVETVKDDKMSEAREDAAAKSPDAAEKGEENEEKAAAEADEQPEETGQGAKSSEEDESSVSELNKKTDETAVPDNAEAEAMTASETMEMKAEPSEEREALSCEEAPVAVTETSQRGDGEDRAAASEAEVTEGSGETTGESARVSEDNAKEESIKDIKEEEVSVVEASKDDSEQEREDLGEEQIGTCVEADEKVEEKCEEGGEQEEKQTKPDETTEGGDVEESQAHDEDKTEEENDESKTEERIEITSNDEQAEKTHSEEEKAADEEEADESEKTEKEEDSVKDKNDEEEAETTAAAALMLANAAGIISETTTAGDEEKKDDTERDLNEDKVEQSEVAKNKDVEESTEKKVVTSKTVEREKVSEKAEEPKKSADGASDKDNVIKSDETTESEDVGEAATVACATITTAEVLNSTMEAEDVMQKTEGGGDGGEKGEVDAENGEISAGAENKPGEDEGENGAKTAEQAEDERKTDEPVEDESKEVKDVTVESGEKEEDEEVAEVESEAKEEDGSVEKQDQSGENDSEEEKSAAEMKEDSKSDERNDSEGTKKDENANLSEPDHENRVDKKSDDDQENVSEVIVVSSVDQEQPSTPTAVDSDDTDLKLERSTEPSESRADKHPNPEENSAATDLSAAEGENGDTEEASKASEEGASVLLKPQAQQTEAENTEEKVAVVEETAETLAREDLVTNWVTVHRTSKFFETFVEPLEDLKESTPDAEGEATMSTELARSESPLKMSQKAEQEHTPKDVDESVNNTKEEAEETELQSNQPADGEPCEEHPAKDELQVEEETEVQDFKTESGQVDKESVAVQEMRSEEHKERRGSLEEEVQEVSTQDNADQIDVSKTEVESITGAHLSVTSGRPESATENQMEEKTTDSNEETTAKEEVKDLPPTSKPEEHRELSASQENLSESKANESEGTEEKLDKSRDVTEISDFTASRSDDGSQTEFKHEEIKPKQSDGSTSGDRRDMQLIQDIKHTLSKDRLSTFSVDETLFGPSSYPLLTAARTESGH
uniref:glutamate-rich protein 3 n=1 Tax=Semicossyphus pulcher TaxID=241346 RepID=UPI0037E8A243